MRLASLGAESGKTELPLSVCTRFHAGAGVALNGQAVVRISRAGKASSSCRCHHKISTLYTHTHTVREPQKRMRKSAKIRPCNPLHTAGAMYVLV